MAIELPSGLESYTDTTPFLPPELERDIFEMTASLHRESWVRLTLVARRTQVWIEAIMYRTVVLDHPTITTKFLHALDSKPVGFFADRVKTLCLAKGISVKQAIYILSRCTGVVNLACWVIPDSYSSALLLPLIGKLGLRSLSLNQRALPGLEPAQINGISSLMPDAGFRNITHLDIVNHWALWNTSGFEVLPYLTHLAFRYWARGSVAMALRNILSSCMSLEVLVILAHNQIMQAALELLDEEGLYDPRLVVLSYFKDIQYWRGLERGELDLWMQAEKIVAIQRKQIF